MLLRLRIACEQGRQGARERQGLVGTRACILRVATCNDANLRGKHREREATREVARQEFAFAFLPHTSLSSLCVCVRVLLLERAAVYSLSLRVSLPQIPERKSLPLLSLACSLLTTHSRSRASLSLSRLVAPLIRVIRFPNLLLERRTIPLSLSCVGVREGDV